jgi:methionyl-tRNA formyltransferase
MWNNEVFKVWEVQNPKHVTSSNTDLSYEPGTVIGLTKQGIEVSTGDGSVFLTIVQPAGKKAMDAGQFMLGGVMKKGTVLL